MLKKWEAIVQAALNEKTHLIDSKESNKEREKSKYKIGHLSKTLLEIHSIVL